MSQVFQSLQISNPDIWDEKQKVIQHKKKFKRVKLEYWSEKKSWKSFETPKFGRKTIKISIEKIASKLDRVKNIVRLIPNATSIINEGYNPLCFAKETHDWDKPTLLETFRILGHTFEVPEQKLESYAIMSAMLPTYFWFQWKELIDLGCKIGLTEDESLNSVRDTMLAALRTYFYSGLTPDEVIDLVPVKPIGDSEAQIKAIYWDKLIPLFEKIKP